MPTPWSPREPRTPEEPGTPEEPWTPQEHGRTAVGWLLHGLEPAEEQRFLDHLDGCDECRRHLREASSVVEALGRAVPQHDPPPGLRERILDAAAGPEPVYDGVATLPGGAGSTTASGADVDAADDPAVARAGSGPTTGSGTTTSGSATASGADGAPDRAPDATVVEMRRRSRRRWLVRGVAAAAGAALIAVVGGLTAANQSLRDDRDSALASAADAQQVARMLDDASAPGVRHATLTTASGAMVGLVADAGQGPRILTTGLPGNGADRTYVLWGLDAGRPVGLGAFDLPGTASTVRSVGSVGQAVPFTGYAVSLEPGHTVPAAPTEIVASGQVGR